MSIHTELQHYRLEGNDYAGSSICQSESSMCLKETALSKTAVCFLRRHRGVIVHSGG